MPSSPATRAATSVRCPVKSGIVLSEIAERRNVPARDDENVRWRLRLNVSDGDNVVILIDHVGRDLARDNAAKEAIGHGSV